MSIYMMLFTPLRVGEMEVKNRIGMAPMTSGYAGEDGYVTRTLIDFYMKRARNGVGLITVESCYIDKGGRGFPLNRLTGTDQSVLILTSTEVKEIGTDYVHVIQATGEKGLTDIDTVIVAVGSKPNLPVDTGQLPQACEVFIVGDALTPRTLFEAVHSASEKAYTV